MCISFKRKFRRGTLKETDEFGMKSLGLVRQQDADLVIIRRFLGLLPQTKSGILCYCQRDLVSPGSFFMGAVLGQPLFVSL